MKRIEHKVVHRYQPTNHTCSQTALSILLSYYGEELTPEEIAQQVAVTKNEKGEDWGTITQQLATWCLERGYAVDMYSFDFQTLDLSWADLSNDKLLERLKAAKGVREIPILGKHFTSEYLQSYIDFITAGGALTLEPYVRSQLLYELLAQGPIFASVNFNVLYNSGRSLNTGLRKTKPDDLKGGLINHSLVIYGNTEDGDFLIADPWVEPGKHAVDPERMLGAIAAAQIECDNLVFTVTR